MILDWETARDMAGHEHSAGWLQGFFHDGKVQMSGNLLPCMTSLFSGAVDVETA